MIIELSKISLLLFLLVAIILGSCTQQPPIVIDCSICPDDTVTVIDTVFRVDTVYVVERDTIIEVDTVFTVVRDTIAITDTLLQVIRDTTIVQDTLFVGVPPDTMFCDTLETVRVDTFIQNEPKIVLWKPSFGLLTWSANKESDLAGYRVYTGESLRNYNLEVHEVGFDTVLNFAELPNEQGFFVAVTAYDSAGNESGYSNEVRINSFADLFPPEDDDLDTTVIEWGDSVKVEAEHMMLDGYVEANEGGQSTTIIKLINGLNFGSASIVVQDTIRQVEIKFLHDVDSRDDFDLYRNDSFEFGFGTVPSVNKWDFIKIPFELFPGDEFEIVGNRSNQASAARIDYVIFYK